MKKLLFLFTLLLSLGFSTLSFGVEPAPRISDREIIESLAELKEGQKSLKESINQRFEAVYQRFETVYQRFEAVDQRFEAVDQRFEAVDQRFDDMNNRFDDMNNRFDDMNNRFDEMNMRMDQRFSDLDKRLAFIENLVMVLIAGVFGLIGFVVWDRRTVLRPLEKRFDLLERDLRHDLELQSPEGSRLTRLIHALRELSDNDPKLAEVLRSFSLL